jgi:hypothetical protein
MLVVGFSGSRVCMLMVVVIGGRNLTRRWGTMVLPNDREARGIPTTCRVNALADADADSELGMKAPG